MKNDNSYARTYFSFVLPNNHVLGRLRDPATYLWLRELEDVFGDVPNKKIFDIGCGCGHKSLLLALLGAEVEGFDIDNYSIGICEESKKKIELSINKGLNVKFFLSDVDCLSNYPDGHFDYILCSEVIGHLPKSKADWFIEEMIRITKTNGIIFITTPNAEKIKLEKYIHRGHEYHWTIGERKKAFSNYKIVKNVYESHPLLRNFNKFFYPLSVTDRIFAKARKIPMALKLCYRVVSFPFLFVFNHVIFHFLVFIFRNHEIPRRNQKSGLTIMFAVCR
jgi:2-polyprenyl-3-methyl-5-hydroxy-6-metoxy-1,4-benzoquinol methylase